MPRFLNTQSTSGDTPISSDVSFKMLSPANLAVPSGTGLHSAVTSSEVQVVQSSGILVISSGVGQWLHTSGNVYSQAPTFGPSSGDLTWYSTEASIVNDVSESGLLRLDDLSPVGINKLVGSATIASGEQNGLDMIWLDGSSSWVFRSSSQLTGTNPPVTIMAVVKPVGDVAGVIYGAAQALELFHGQIFLQVLSTNEFRYFKRNDDSSSSATVTLGLSIGGQATLITVVDDGNECRMYHDGIELTQTPSGTTVGAVTPDREAIGARPRSTVDSRFVGAVGEVIVYDVAISEAERESVEVYLLEKWGI